jgi:prepilin-type N-terminal cleavage/methylation domain-containing protein
MRGFSLVEVVVATVLFVVGALALAGSIGMSSRMIGRGRQSTVAAQVATARLEWLLQIAQSTIPACTHADFADGTADSAGILERWTVPSTGIARRVALALEYRTAAGAARDTLRSAIPCR